MFEQIDGPLLIMNSKGKKIFIQKDSSFEYYSFQSSINIKVMDCRYILKLGVISLNVVIETILVEEIA